jgi:hypothetical protein
MTRYLPDPWTAGYSSGGGAASSWGNNTIVAFGPSGGDDTARLQAALNALPSGGALCLHGRIQVSSGNIIMPQFTSMITWVAPSMPQAGDFSQLSPTIVLNGAYTIFAQRGCNLFGFNIHRQGLITSTTVQNAYLEIAARTGIAVQVAQSASNPSLSANDVCIRDVFIIGFSTGIKCVNGPRLWIEGVKCDCTNAFDIQNVGDTLRLSNCHHKTYCFATLPNGVPGSSWGTPANQNRLWQISGVSSGSGGQVQISTTQLHPFATGNQVLITGMQGSAAQSTNGRWPITVVDVHNLLLNGSTFSAGGYDWTTGPAGVFALLQNMGFGYGVTNCDAVQVQNCFSHGWDIGYRVRSTSGKFVNCGYEGSGSGVINDPIPVGLQIDYDGVNVPTDFRWVCGDVNDCGTAILYDPLGGTSNSIQGMIIGGRINYGQHGVLRNPLDPTSLNYSVKAVSGVLRFTDVDWTGGASGTLYAGDGMQGVFFDLNPNLAITEQTANADAQKVVIAAAGLQPSQYSRNGNAGPVIAKKFDMSGAQYCVVEYTSAGNAGATTVTTRTCAQLIDDFYPIIVTAWANFSYSLRVRNTSSNTITLTAPDASVAIVTGGSAGTIAAGKFVDYIVTFNTALTVVTFQNVGGN